MRAGQEDVGAQLLHDMEERGICQKTRRLAEKAEPLTKR
jgi:hypothetical protein